MKYFSLSYMLSEKDYSDYEKIVFKGSIIMSAKRMLIPFVLVVAMCIFMDVLFLISALTYFALSIIIPQFINREFSHKTRKNSKLLRRMMNIDFYDNHFVVSYEPNEYVRSHSEKHYGFDMVQNVLESAENIYFAFNDNSLLIIPKAILDSEKYNMISNLIANLFRNKYQRLG
ncbi:MAG: hypothetical protein J6V06_02745 [Clostridia bacterium]|nr:hypothetical protein [Clostridia bacterium]MBO7318924.1 hypothetical protein [Clostridia bacterium]